MVWLRHVETLTDVLMMECVEKKFKKSKHCLHWNVSTGCQGMVEVKEWCICHELKMVIDQFDSLPGN